MPASMKSCNDTTAYAQRCNYTASTGLLLHIQSSLTNEVTPVEVEADAKVQDVVEKYELVQRRLTGEITGKLKWLGRELGPEESLADAGVCQESHVEYTPQGRGWKPKSNQALDAVLREQLRKSNHNNVQLVRTTMLLMAIITGLAIYVLIKNSPGCDSESLLQVLQDTYGIRIGDASCSNDDCRSSVSCGDGEWVQKCEILGSSGDGVWVSADGKTCTAQAAGDRKTIKAKATCGPLRTLSVSSVGVYGYEGENKYVGNEGNGSVGCPHNATPLSCNCHSAWTVDKMCGGTEEFPPVGNFCRVENGGSRFRVFAVCPEGPSVAASLPCTGEGCLSAATCPLNQWVQRCETVPPHSGHGAYPSGDGKVCTAQGVPLGAVGAKALCGSRRTYGVESSPPTVWRDGVVSVGCPGQLEPVGCTCYTERASGVKGGCGPSGAEFPPTNSSCTVEGARWVRVFAVCAETSQDDPPVDTDVHNTSQRS